VEASSNVSVWRARRMRTVMSFYWTTRSAPWTRSSENTFSSE
jgi:hypothetical protein